MLVLAFQVIKCVPQLRTLLHVCESAQLSCISE